MLTSGQRFIIVYASIFAAALAAIALVSIAVSHG